MVVIEEGPRWEKHEESRTFLKNQHKNGIKFQQLLSIVPQNFGLKGEKGISKMHASGFGEHLLQYFSRCDACYPKLLVCLNREIL